MPFYTKFNAMYIIWEFGVVVSEGRVAVYSDTMTE